MKIERHGVPQDMASVDALINKKDDRASKEFEKWVILTSFDGLGLDTKEKREPLKLAQSSK